MAGHQTSAIAVAQEPDQSIGQDEIKPSIGRLVSFVKMPETLVFCGGLLLTICCAVLAILDGMSVPIVLMAGYCSLVASVVLAAVLRNFTATATEQPAPVDVTQDNKPNFAAWKLVSTLNVANASRLWCGIQPGHPYSQDSMAWATAMLDAIRTGALPIVGKSKETIEREKANPTWHTGLTREALKAWAKANGHNPEFLRD